MSNACLRTKRGSALGPACDGSGRKRRVIGKLYGSVGNFDAGRWPRAHPSTSIAVVSQSDRTFSAAAASARSIVNPYLRRTSSVIATNQQPFRAGVHSAMSLPLFWCRLTLGPASVRVQQVRRERRLDRRRRGAQAAVVRLRGRHHMLDVRLPRAAETAARVRPVDLAHRRHDPRLEGGLGIAVIRAVVSPAAALGGDLDAPVGVRPPTPTRKRAPRSVQHVAFVDLAIVGDRGVHRDESELPAVNGARQRCRHAWLVYFPNPPSVRCALSSAGGVPPPRHGR